MPASEFGVGRDRARRREVQIALQRKSQRATRGSELLQAHLGDLRLAEAEIAETEGQIAVRIQLRQEPGGIAVGGEDFDDRFEVDGPR